MAPASNNWAIALHGLARTRHRRPQRRHIAAVGLRRLRARRNEGGAAARLEHREGFLRHIAADGVEHGVATFHHLGEILCVVVDDLVGAETADIIDVRGARRGDDVARRGTWRTEWQSRRRRRRRLGSGSSRRACSFSVPSMRIDRGQTGQRQRGRVDVRQLLAASWRRPRPRSRSSRSRCLPCPARERRTPRHRP